MESHSLILEFRRRSRNPSIRRVGSWIRRRSRTPPPDEAKIDQATIDALLTDLGWERRTPLAAEILAVVGHAEVGRAISYRQSQFIYESVVESDYRKIIATFSTAAAARRS
jgi:hypothetical protein